jgi:uncharacterized protein (TIGR03905 family)
MKYHYRAHGVCLQSIDWEVIDGKVHNVVFTGGCPGNSQAVSALVEGLEVTDVISRLKGIRCKDSITSCPDQLATALDLTT